MLAFLINHTFVNFHTYLKKRSQNLILISLDLHFRHLRFLSQTDFYFYAFSILNCNTLLKQNLHSVFLLKFHFHDKHFKKKKKKKNPGVITLSHGWSQGSVENFSLKREDKTLKLVLSVSISRVNERLNIGIINWNYVLYKSGPD